MDLLTELRNIISDEDRVSVDGEVLEHHGRVFPTTRHTLRT